MSPGAKLHGMGRKEHPLGLDFKDRKKSKRTPGTGNSENEGLCKIKLGVLKTYGKKK